MEAREGRVGKQVGRECIVRFKPLSFRLRLRMAQFMVA